jgi:CRISPR system Cascade subunit CasE
MLQLAPDLAGLIRWAQPRGLLPARGDDDLGYALHALLSAAFGTLAPAPFALIRHTARPPTLLAYSAHSGPALREQAATFAEPAVTMALGLATLADKPMPARFAAGRRLGFTLRARPIVRVDREGDRTQARERDAYLAAIAGTKPGEGPSRGDVYQAWLAARLAAGGARTEHLTLEAFRLGTTLRRNAGRTLRPFCGPEAGFSGVLSVADPDRFGTLLARGVGRHRAFGFGMLLLKPA